MPLLPIPTNYYRHEIQQPMTLKWPMLMPSFQHKNTQFMPPTLPTLEVASPSINCTNPAACTTLTQSLQIATAHDSTQFGQLHDHKPCNVWHVATTQSPSISHHLTSTLTTILDTAKTLEPPLDTYQGPTTTPSHHLAAMVSINNPLQHQLQALKTIKGLLDTLCTLIECLVNMLTMDLNYPNHLLPAPLCKLCMPHRLWLHIKTSCTNPYQENSPLTAPNPDQDQTHCSLWLSSLI